jgi:hypothetical protein
MGVTPKHIAALLVLVGAALIVAGVALATGLPGALFAGGVALAALGAAGLDA